jgi:hypothetical protein
MEIKTFFLTDPVPYQSTRRYTEIVEFEIDEEEDEEELPSKVKYATIVQDESSEEEEEYEDFFRDK